MSPTWFGAIGSLRRIVWVSLLGLLISASVGAVTHDYVDTLIIPVLALGYGLLEYRSDARRRSEQQKIGLGLKGMSPVNQSSPEAKE